MKDPTKSCVRLGDRTQQFITSESLKTLVARRIVAHPDATVKDVTQWFDPYSGANGSICVVVRAEICQLVFEESERDVGDAGGAGDRLIAHAARSVTGESEPVKVAESVGRHHVRSVKDLGRALGMEPGDMISTEMRAEIGRILGFVEPALPECVKPGIVVHSRYNRSRLIEEVDERGVKLSGYPEPIPAGVFIAEGWSSQAGLRENRTEPA